MSRPLSLKTLIKNKNTFGVEKLLAKADISPELKKLFASLTSLFGTEEVLDKAAVMTTNPGCTIGAGATARDLADSEAI